MIPRVCNRLRDLRGASQKKRDKKRGDFVVIIITGLGTNSIAWISLK